MVGVCRKARVPHIGCAPLCATNPTRWSSTADFTVEPTPSNAFGASVTDGIEHLFDRPGGHLLRGPGRRIPTGFVISIVFAPAGTNPWARSFVSALQGRDSELPSPQIFYRFSPSNRLQQA
jgi:hypothetical protein